MDEGTGRGVVVVRRERGDYVGPVPWGMKSKDGELILDKSMEGCDVCSTGLELDEPMRIVQPVFAIREDWSEGSILEKLGLRSAAGDDDSPESETTN